MEVQKGDLLNIRHSRKGFFKAVATQAFDTDEEEFYPIVLAPDQYVKGMADDWVSGEKISCRKSLVTLILIEEVLEEDEQENPGGER